MSAPSKMIVARGRRDQPDQQAPERGFAAAGLADQAQRLAWFDAQRHAVDRAQRDACGGAEDRRRAPGNAWSAPTASTSGVITSAQAPPRADAGGA